MNNKSKSPKGNQSGLSSSKNQGQFSKKQFPSISLSKQLEDYKAYRSIEQKKKFPDLGNNNTYTMSPEDKSMLMGEMPSIHNANQVSSCEGFLLLSEGRLQKLQQKVLRNVLATNREKQWRLYITKSQLIPERTRQFQQIEQYLLRVISKSVQKAWLSYNEAQGQQEMAFQQNSLLLAVQPADKKFNKTYSNSISQAANGLNRKPSQPSLRALKQQFNTNLREASILQQGSSSNLGAINKTSANFRQEKAVLTDKREKAVVIDKREDKYQQELNKMTFERSLLQKKLQLYHSRILKLEAILQQEGIQVQPQSSRNKQDSQEGQRQRKAAKKPMTSEQLIMNNLINQNKYKSEVEFRKIQNEILVRQLDVVRELTFKLKLDNDRLLFRAGELQTEAQKCRQFMRYKQLWLMQAEQMAVWKQMWKERKQDNMKLNGKIKILKEKNKQLLQSFNFSMVVNPDQQQDKQQLENIIKGFQEWLKVISVPRVNCPSIDPESLLSQMNVKQTQFISDPENFNYKLLRPNFFIFFQAYQKTIMMEKNILNTRPLEHTFFVKIRAILDSMYNHFNSFGCYKHWTPFPEFVIGFMEKYEINFLTLKMEPRRKPMPSEEKLTFLMNLFNKKLSNTWECQIFRSFIMEEYTLDQIYFFLDCRNDLNGGSVLTHGFGTMDPVTYVKLHKALVTAQKKLVPYQTNIIQRVKTIIKSRKKQKSGELFIDKHFVLKLLLQVYALQKSKCQRILQALFKTKSGKKMAISYSQYLLFMRKNFQFLTTIDICQLYRETYALSSGKINHKAVHYICLSKGLFIPLIWSKRLNMNVLDKSLSSDMMLLDLQNNARKISNHLAQLGVQEVDRLENDLNYFLRQLDWYRNNSQVFYFKLQEMKIRIIKANCLLDWQKSTYTPNELLSTDQIRQGILQIHSLIHQSNSSTGFLSKKRQQKDKAIKQITHNFKIRIQQSISQFRRIDEDQLKKLKDQVALQIKMRELRKKDDDLEKINQEKQDIIEPSVIGGGLKSVNDMILGKRNEARKRTLKRNDNINYITPQIKENRESQPQMNEDANQLQ